MRCSLLRTWLGTSLLGAMLACGCQHAPRSCRQCESCAARAPAVPVSPNPTTYAPNALDKPAILPIANPTPILHTTAKPNPAASTDVAMINGRRNSASSSEVDSSFLQSVVNPYREGPAGRRTFTDITAHPKFAHDPNYRWMVGRLEYSKMRQTWTLRFASVEEEDRHGGSVTLHNPGRMAAFRSGQLVRVEGQLVDSEDSRPRPLFHAYSIRPVEP